VRIDKYEDRLIIANTVCISQWLEHHMIHILKSINTFIIVIKSVILRH